MCKCENANCYGVINKCLNILHLSVDIYTPKMQTCFSSDFSSSDMMRDLSVFFSECCLITFDASAPTPIEAFLMHY